MEKKEPSLSHLLDLDKVTGTEYIAWSEDLFSPDFFIHYGQETTYEKLYNQLEFAKEYGTNLCTCYGPLTTLSIIMGRELTSDERLELVKSRVAQGDFEPSIGGFTSIWVDVVRRWYNTKYPSDPIHTALVNDMVLLRELAQRNIPITTSLRWNKEFTLDTVDGVMDKLNYWLFTSPRYGHCRTRRKLDVLDNYLRKYHYKGIDDLELCMTHAFESRNVFVFFKDSSLSDLGRVYLKGMKAGLWNWERANNFITRYESSRICLKINPLIKEKDIWNWKDGGRNASIYEVTLMLSKVSTIPVYLWADRNKEITRGDTIRLIYSV